MATTASAQRITCLIPGSESIARDRRNQDDTRQSTYAAVTTTIQLRFDGRSTPIKGH